MQKISVAVIGVTLNLMGCRYAYDNPAELGQPKKEETCIANAVFCDGNTAKKCGENGTVTEREKCGIQSVCIEGVCDPNPICLPGETLCIGNVLTKCDATGDSLEAEIDCEPMVCANGACILRGEDLCPANVAFCQDNRALICNQQGSAYEVETDCGDQACINGACFPLVCDPGVATCNNGVAESCHISGTSIIPIETCQAEMTCVSGRCQEAICSPGRACDQNFRFTCNEQGTQIIDRRDCAPGICVSGACEDSPPRDAGLDATVTSPDRVVSDSGGGVDGHAFPDAIVATDGGHDAWLDDAWVADSVMMADRGVAVDSAAADANGDAAQIDDAHIDDAWLPDTARADTSDCTVDGCDGFFYCDTGSGDCLPGCGSSAQCGDNEVCDLGLHVCKCNSTSLDCGAGCAACPTTGVVTTTCSGTACVAVECETAERPRRGYHICGDACCQWNLTKIETLDDDSSWAAIELDSNEYPHIAYIDQTEGVVRYAYWDGQGWQTEDVVSLLAFKVGLTLDTQDRPHIVYLHNHSAVRYANKIGGTWSSQTIGTDGDFPAIDSDASDNLHVVFRDLSGYSFAVIYRASADGGGTWSAETVQQGSNPGSNPGFNAAIAVTPGGTPHVVYGDYEGSTLLKYGVRNVATWNVEDLDDASFCQLSIVLDDLNKPHVAYEGREAPYLRYTYKSGTSWVYESTGFGDGTDFVSLALDSQHQPRILFSANITLSPLFLATKKDGTWRHEQVREYGHPGEGGRAIEIDSTDALHFAFTSYTRPRSVYYGQ